MLFLISRESVFDSHYKICSGSSHTISLCLLCDSVYLLCPNTWFMFCVRFSLLSVAYVPGVNFKVYTLSNSDNVCDECCVHMYLGHVSLATIRRDFGREFTGCKFPTPPPPKFIVDLSQSVLECAFNAQRCVRSFGSISYACKTVRF